MSKQTHKTEQKRKISSFHIYSGRFQRNPHHTSQQIVPTTVFSGEQVLLLTASGLPSRRGGRARRKRAGDVLFLREADMELSTRLFQIGYPPFCNEHAVLTSERMLAGWGRVWSDNTIMHGWLVPSFPRADTAVTSMQLAAGIQFGHIKMSCLPPLGDQQGYMKLCLMKGKYFLKMVYSKNMGKLVWLIYFLTISLKQ